MQFNRITASTEQMGGGALEVDPEAFDLSALEVR